MPDSLGSLSQLDDSSLAESENLKEVTLHPRNAGPTSPVTEAGKITVSPDEFATIVADKALKLFEERRRVSTRLLGGGVLTAIGVVSYLGISNLRGMVGDVVASETDRTRTQLERQANTHSDALKASNDSARASTTLLLQELESRFGQKITELNRALADHDHKEGDTRKAEIQQVHGQFSLELDSLRSALVSDLAQKIAQVKESASEDRQIVERLIRQQEQQVTLLTLDGVVKALEGTTSFSNAQRDKMVSSIVALAGARDLRSNLDFATAVRKVVTRLASARQVSEVDEVERAVRPTIEAICSPTPTESVPSAVAIEWRLTAKEFTEHYGQLLCAGDEPQRKPDGPVAKQFARYVQVLTNVRYRENALPYELMVWGASDNPGTVPLMELWDATSSMTAEEQRYVVLQLLFYTKESYWSNSTTPMGKRMERVARRTWSSLNDELRALFEREDFRKEWLAYTQTMSDDGVKNAMQLVGSGKSPWHSEPEPGGR